VKVNELKSLAIIAGYEPYTEFTNYKDDLICYLVKGENQKGALIDPDIKDSTSTWQPQINLNQFYEVLFAAADKGVNIQHFIMGEAVYWDAYTEDVVSHKSQESTRDSFQGDMLRAILTLAGYE